MKVVVFTGAGVSQESGIDTFRDKGGLWDKFTIGEVATAQAWVENTEVCIDFYNKRRKELEGVQPNRAHELIAKLQDEENFDVTVITQNVDDLHERAGSKNIYHLHGELTWVRSEKDPSDMLHVGYKPVLLGEVASDGEQYRPHVVLFGEDVPMLHVVKPICNEADIFIVIGSSLNVYPAANLIMDTNPEAKLYNINPEGTPVDFRHMGIESIEEKAVAGMEKLFNILTKKE